MDIGEAAEMVAKNGRDFVSLPEEESFALSFVARNWGLWLVNGYALARFGNCFDLVGLCLCSPRLLGSDWHRGTRQAASRFGISPLAAMRRMFVNGRCPRR
jgi:hypothetical protein